MQCLARYKSVLEVVVTSGFYPLQIWNQNRAQLSFPHHRTQVPLCGLLPLSRGIFLLKMHIEKWGDFVKGVHLPNKKSC